MKKIEGKLLASSAGKLRWLLMSFDGEDIGHFVGVLTQLLPMLPRHTSVLVICTDGMETYLAEAMRCTPDKICKQVSLVQAGAVCVRLSDARIFITGSGGRRVVSPWSRDLFLVRRLFGREQFFEFSNTVQAMDSTTDLTPILAGFCFPKMKVVAGKPIARFCLEGGNVLSETDFLLVGREDWRTSWAKGRCFSDAAAAELNLKNYSGIQKIEVVGQEKDFPRSENKSEAWLSNVFIHLDTHVSLTGTWLKTAEKPKRKKYVLLVAKIETVITRNGVEEKYERFRTLLNQYLDKVAEQLGEQFVVWRNPIPIFESYRLDERENGVQELVVDNTPIYLGVINNVIFEVSKKRKKVWLPSLRFSDFHKKGELALLQMEAKNRSLWQNLGFQPEFVPANFHHFFKGNSALRCLTNPIIF